MWSNVIKYYKRCNELYEEKYNAKIIKFEDFKNLMFNENNLDFSRDVSNMTLDDCIFFASLLKISEDNEKLLLKYKDENIWNSPLLRYKDSFKIYNNLLKSFRGIVINTELIEIIVCPFDKFANINEEGWEENTLENITIEFNNAKTIEISDKLDGSLQSGRWYKNNLFLSGSGSIVKENSPSLLEGYNWISNQENYITMLKDNPNDTHIFEWISKNDAHIVNYKLEQTGLYLIGIRNVNTGKLYSYKDVLNRAKLYNVKTTTLYNKTLEELLEDCKIYKSFEKEGFVISLDGHMVKLKAIDYINIVSIIKKSSSINVLLKAIKKGTLDDLLSKVPLNSRSLINAKIDYIHLYMSTMNEKINYYYNLAPKEDIKTFMNWSKENVPKFLLSEVINKYKNKEDSILGTIYYNSKNELIENMKSLTEIESIMNNLGLMTLSEYIKNN